MFKRLCIANRGEIAVRIARTCRRLGIVSHALYSDADATSLHVRVADTASRIGLPPVSDSYLNIEAVIAAALAAKCDAVHPGYGLLSENAAFARVCQEQGLVFIGPAPEHIELMGEKHRAREAMAHQGVPLVPGSEGLVRDEFAESLAEEIGYPLMIKAANGGGGIGMAVVEEPSHLLRSLGRARSTSLRAFGSGDLYFERQIQGAHHVELQILGDGKGGVAVVGDRECSVQRRHQKVIEEAPAPALEPETRQSLRQLVADALAAIQYRNAGTVECLLDGEGNFYFLEMNTRLQVEHPVTEMVTGLDLVEWQIRIAAGETLDRLEVPEVPDGHSIEARIYAEDPTTLFPSPGPVELFFVPAKDGVRVDSGVAAGDLVTPYYDPMIAKLIVHATNRDNAVRLLRETLAVTELTGLKHNIPFLMRVLDTPAFIDGSYTVGLVPELMSASER